MGHAIDVDSGWQTNVMIPPHLLSMHAQIHQEGVRTSK